MDTKGKSLLGFDQNDAQNSTSCDQNDVQKRIPIRCWDLMDTKRKSLLGFDQNGAQNSAFRAFKIFVWI